MTVADHVLLTYDRAWTHCWTERGRGGQPLAHWLSDRSSLEGWCWPLMDVCRLAAPVACRGAQGLWRLPEDVERQVLEQGDGR